MARTDTATIGRRAEAMALGHLRAQGLTTITTNFRCRMGEIDLVMRDGACLVFAEVRFRSESRFASAAGSIDLYKQRKIIRTAAAFLGRNPKYGGCAVRFDVVALDGTDGQISLRWIKDAFRPE